MFPRVLKHLITLHYITLHYLHYITLHYITLHHYGILQLALYPDHTLYHAISVLCTSAAYDSLHVPQG